MSPPALQGLSAGTVVTPLSLRFTEPGCWAVRFSHHVGFGCIGLVDFKSMERALRIRRI